MEDRNKKNEEFENIKRRIVNKSIELTDLVKDKYFQTLLGSYCLYMQLCDPLTTDSYVKDQINQFPKESELIRSFLTFINEEQGSAFIKSSSSFDMNLASKQISANGQGRKK
jgi:hypothetical protein